MSDRRFTDEEIRYWKRLTARTARYLFGPLEDEWKWKYQEQNDQGQIQGGDEMTSEAQT